MDLIDTHCHLDVKDFDVDRSQVLQRSRAAGVKRMVVPAVDRAHWAGLIGLCNAEDGLYPALGLHPVFIDSHRDEDLDALQAAIAQQPPVAIGEIGLDFYVRELDRDRQQHFLEAQLQLAKNAALPVILHVRKAHDEVLSTLRRLQVAGGTVHAFNGSLQQAGQYLDLGFKLGFGGMLTYQRSSKLRKLARDLPLDALVLETDAPDMTVCTHQGERNSPEYLPECLRALAEVRTEAMEYLAEKTTENACTVFSLQKFAGRH